MNINSKNFPNSISEQRETLLKMNQDLLYGVYSLQDETNHSFDLKFQENVLTCYPNQLENLKWLEENSEITIVNLWALRKWNIEILNWPKIEITNPVLLSNWVIELIEAKKADWTTRKHLISTLRDDWAADSLQRTTTAGRNSWYNLQEDLEREHIEESPFLGRNKDGELALATIDNSNESIELLIESIWMFLERKYLHEWDENYDFVKKNFERNFPWILYDELWNILTDIIKNKRFATYSTEKIEEFEWLEWDMKTVSIWDSTGKYFVYHDKENNTIEYRQLRTITGFNDWFKPLSKRSSRLYLESENQFSKTHRIENAQEVFVPTIKYFSEKCSDILFDINNDIFISELSWIDKLYFNIFNKNNWINISDFDFRWFLLTLIKQWFLEIDFNTLPSYRYSDWRTNLPAFTIYWNVIRDKNLWVALNHKEFYADNKWNIYFTVWFYDSWWNPSDGGLYQSITYKIQKT